jgi:hypothetical protein
MEALFVETAARDGNYFESFCPFIILDIIRNNGYYYIGILKMYVGKIQYMVMMSKQ